ncbi:GAD-like domain-containing protein [Pseudomonas sp. S2_H01]
MDEYFEYFLSKMGPAIEPHKIPSSVMVQYKNKLPGQLLEQWAKYGWSGYGEGVFWTVNPADYEDVVHEWLKQSGISSADQYHVIARGAFGDLYLWQQTTGTVLKIALVYARYHEDKKTVLAKDFDEEIKAFFAFTRRESNDFDNLFEEAVKKLGRLRYDEMYGFVPAIALGGPVELKHLQKVKIIEHLAFLSQLTPLTDWGFPDYDTIMKLTE